MITYSYFIKRRP